MINLDKKVQLAILEKVHNKLRRKLIEIDSSDPVFRYNFEWLRDTKKCFVLATRKETEIQYFPDGSVEEIPMSFDSKQYIAELSEEGKEYLEQLAAEIKEEDRKDEKMILLRRETVSAEEANVIAREAIAEAKKANVRSFRANVIAGISLFVAIVSAAIALCK